MSRNMFIITLGLLCALSSTGVVTGQTTWYVDDDALSGTRDGTSWTTAYQFLQDALTAAQPFDIVHMAEGNYHPDDDDDIPASTHTTGDTSVSFILLDRVEIKGGFIGNNTLGIDPNTRDWDAHKTILSGDLNDNDLPGPGYLSSLTLGPSSTIPPLPTTPARPERWSAAGPSPYAMVPPSRFATVR